MFPLPLIADTVRAIFELKRQPRPPVPEPTPGPDELYRQLIFEVFETGKDITYHDVSKPRPKDAPPLGTYMGDPIYDAPMDMYRLLDGDRHRYISRREYMERTAARLVPPHWVEVELRHAPTGAFIRHRRRDNSPSDSGSYTIGHAGGAETVSGEATKLARRYFLEHWDRVRVKQEERADEARMDRVRSFLPKFEAWLDAA